MATRGGAFADAISASLPRTKADTLVAELLPLLDACRFLERNAERLLAPRRLGTAGRPFWLRGVDAEVRREPLGHVLVIGPANFPLFLPGVQVLQALAAGNRVTWKPGAGGGHVAQLVAEALREAGLPNGALRIAADTVEAAHDALSSKPDKVFFTGSSAAGRAVLGMLADTATPAVVEMSGSDAVIVLPKADLRTTAKAIAFGLRLNGGQVCMSPRRVFASAGVLEALKPHLLRELQGVAAVPLRADIAAKLSKLVQEAQETGAVLHGVLDGPEQAPLVIDSATPNMVITRSDIFAPVISLLPLRSMLELPEAYNACPYALTVSIFCGKDEETQAREIASTLRAGTVLINDLIAPTADPRVPFGGRGASGYGSTRGAEGLLEMTAVKTVLVRRGGAMRHLVPMRNEDAIAISGLIKASHGRGWRTRMGGLLTVLRASRTASKYRGQRGK